MEKEKPDTLPDHVEEEPQKYVPRPRWQLIAAWILIGIVVLGVINVCYWQIHG